MANNGRRPNHASRLLGLVGLTTAVMAMLVYCVLHHERDIQQCDMTYMNPVYIPMNNPKPPSRLNDTYALYLYRERGVDTPDRLAGAPALFIPGHAGSYRQSRSIAAEAARYAKQKGIQGLDVFTVDLNDAFSGIHGQLLYDQAEYCHDVIQYILSLYSGPSSVIVIGHSMGGVVARLMLTYPDAPVSTLLTLATPHTAPPVVLDPKMVRVYQEIHETRPATLVSIAAGMADNIVNSELADVTSLGGLTVYATGVPTVWTTCDHMAILWCNQLVKRVAAALVESIHAQDPRRIFEDYLLSRPGRIPKNITPLPKDIQTEEVLEQEYAARLSPRVVLLHPRQSRSFGMVTDHPQAVRPLLCGASMMCTDASNKAVLLPFHKDKPLSFIELDSSAVQHYPTVAIQTSAADGFVLAGLYDAAPRTVHLDWLDLIQGKAVLTLPAQLHTVLHLPTLRTPRVALKLHAPALQAPLILKQAGAVEAKFHTIEAHRAVHLVSHQDIREQGLRLDIWQLQPAPVTLRISLDWQGSAYQVALRCAPFLPTALFLVALALLAFSGQQASFPETLEKVQWLWPPLLVLVMVWHSHWMALCVALSVGFVSTIYILLTGIIGGLRCVLPRVVLPITGVAVVIALVASLCGWVPVSAALVALYVLALFRTVKRQITETALIFLTCLLPYVIPSLLVFIREIQEAGYVMPALPWDAILDEAPLLGTFLTLALMGRRPKWTSFVCLGALLYYSTYGMQNAYPIQMYFVHP
ncbi:PGAP1-like protein-domain-containing protein [Syncephalastrum racemosum]|uniref:GPI inositol-deacylase n=1 Tax=Syncephalastrum racemosum TaxID=13706 RepID=A0A1X2HQT4_SYNRA|nr:PGAP1-like protein-domain-containing protein [Syncephalastrum racemosum]